MIKGLGEDLPTKGFLKIGEKSDPNSRLKGAPRKFDHIEITTRARDKKGNLTPDLAEMGKILSYEGVTTCGGCDRSRDLGFSEGLPTRVPVFLPYNEIENIIPNRLAWYRSGTAFCTGDMETAQRLKVLNEKELEQGTAQGPVYGPAEPFGPCGEECPAFRQRKCKPNGRVSLILATQPSIGSVYQFKTTSWNSIRNVVNGLKGIQRQTAGVLQWVPMWFGIHPQSVTPKDGPTNIQMIATIECPGDPNQALQLVLGTLRERAPLLAEVRKLEAGIVEEAHWVEGQVEGDAFQEEYYPEGDAAGPPQRDESLLDEDDIARLNEIAGQRAEVLRMLPEYEGLTGDELLQVFLREKEIEVIAEVPKADLPELLMTLSEYEPGDPHEDPFADRPDENAQSPGPAPSQDGKAGEPEQGSFGDDAFDGM
jgi:hypothetical protein